jgi:hypothetical protein
MHHLLSVGRDNRPGRPVGPELDNLACQSREVDVRLHAANWATDLIET